MLKYLKLYRLILRTFGFKVRPIGTWVLLHLRFLFNAAASSADHVLFPGFRQIPIDRPVFILGNPRSGTTFLHRFLLHTEELCAFELWEMLFPAITARRMLQGVVSHLAPLSPARYHSADAHETSLRDVETDDAMAFFRFVDGGFLWSYFLAWEDRWGSESCARYFEPEKQPASEFERTFRYLESCWRRNMYVKGRPRIAVKTSISTLQVDRLLERYPDCKLIYVVRDPVEAIPSGMSLLTGVLEQSYDVFTKTHPVARQNYLENLYQASCQMYRAFHRAWTSGAIPSSNLRIVAYPQLMDSFGRTVSELFDFVGIEPSQSLRDRVRQQALLQRSRSSRHRYSLETFGLSEERIRSDLAFVYDAYEVA